MARIKIKDLPKDRKITEAEMRQVRGGGMFSWISWLWQEDPNAPSVQGPAGGSADAFPKFKS